MPTSSFAKTRRLIRLGAAIRSDEVIDMLIKQRHRGFGSSFELGRLLVFAQRRGVGPFIIQRRA